MRPSRIQVSMKQMASSSRERDFFRWIKLPLSIFKVEVPIRVRARHTGVPEHSSTETVAMILPSEMLQALHAAGKEASGISALKLVV